MNSTLSSGNSRRTRPASPASGVATAIGNSEEVGWSLGLDLPPPLTVSQWADANRVLSREYAAEPGRWNTDRAPYQREMMDAANDPGVEVIVLKLASQLGKSEVLNNICGYHMDQDPAPILFVLPTLELAEAYSKNRIAGMIRDTPPLLEKVGPPRGRTTSTARRGNQKARAMPARRSG